MKHRLERLAVCVALVCLLGTALTGRPAGAAQPATAPIVFQPVDSHGVLTFGDDVWQLHVQTRHGYGVGGFTLTTGPANPSGGGKNALQGGGLPSTSGAQWGLTVGAGTANVDQALFTTYPSTTPTAVWLDPYASVATDTTGVTITYAVTGRGRLNNTSTLRLALTSGVPTITTSVLAAPSGHITDVAESTLFDLALGHDDGPVLNTGQSITSGPAPLNFGCSFSSPSCTRADADLAEFQTYDNDGQNERGARGLEFDGTASSGTVLSGIYGCWQDLRDNGTVAGDAATTASSCPDPTGHSGDSAVRTDAVSRPADGVATTQTWTIGSVAPASTPQATVAQHVSLGPIPVGQTTQVSVPLTNDGGQSLVFDQVNALADPTHNPLDNAVTASAGTCAPSVAAGASCALTFTFAPLVPGIVNEDFALNSNEPWSATVIHVWAKALNAFATDPPANRAGWSNGPVVAHLSPATSAGGPAAKVTWAISGAQRGGATVAGSTVDVPIHAEGTTLVTAIPYNAAGSATTGPTQTGLVHIDTVPPAITISSPQPGATYASGFQPRASYTCTDATSGVGSGDCTGTAANLAPIDTTALGAHQFAVVAYDLAGNSAVQTVTYTVVPAKPARVTLLVNPQPGVVGQTTTITANVTDPVTAAAHPTGTVQLVDTANTFGATPTTLGTATLSNGVATLTATLTPRLGGDTITATYSGSSVYGTATATQSYAVSDPSTAPTGLVTLAGGGPAPLRTATLTNGIVGSSAVGSLAVAADGSVLSADFVRGEVRSVGPDDRITTVAGIPNLLSLSDAIANGSAATSLHIQPTEVTTGGGATYVSTCVGGVGRILVVSANGTVATLAGGGTGAEPQPTSGPLPPVTSSTSVALPCATALAYSNGSVYFAQARSGSSTNATLYGVTATNPSLSTIQAIGGGGTAAPPAAPSSANATTVSLGRLGDLKTAADGSLYGVETISGTIVRVVVSSSSAPVSRVAGTTNAHMDSGPDGSAATSTDLLTPTAVTPYGSSFCFTDRQPGLIRCVRNDGTIVTVAGTGAQGAATSGPARSSALSNVSALAARADGSLLVSLADTPAIWRLAPGSTSTGGVPTFTIAPWAEPGAMDVTDGSVAAQAHLGPTTAVAATAQGPVFADESATVWRANADGTLTRLAGAQVHGDQGDAAVAGTSAVIGTVSAIAVAGDGSLLLADRDQGKVRRLTSSGSLTTIASGLDSPSGIAVAPDGTIVVAEPTDGRVVRLPSGGGTATTIGTGLSSPTGVAVGPSGVVYVSDAGDDTIRIPAGDIVAGKAGTPGSTDGAVAGATFNQPGALWLTSSGNLDVADVGNHLVRQVQLGAGQVATLAGNGSTAYAEALELRRTGLDPRALAVDAAGRLLVADRVNNAVRVSSLVTGADGVTLSVNGVQPVAADQPVTLVVGTVNLDQHTVGAITIRDGTTVLGTVRAAGGDLFFGPTTLVLPAGALAAGLHTLTATMVVNPAGAPTVATTPLQVIASTATLTTVQATTTPGVMTIGATVAFASTLGPVNGGYVTFTLGNVAADGTVSGVTSIGGAAVLNGVVTLRTFQEPAPSTFQVVATYQPASGYGASTSPPTTVRVPGGLTPTLASTTSPAPTKSNTPAITTTVTPPSSMPTAPTPTGTVSILLQDASGNVVASLSQATLTGGSASSTAPSLADGTYSLVVRYSGDGTYVPATRTTTYTVSG